MRINPLRYRQAIQACFTGKNIGGTLGMPMEGQCFAQALDFYEPYPSQAVPNDDLDMQLAYLVVVEELGRLPTISEFADLWLRHKSLDWAADLLPTLARRGE